jgi:2-iminobutanoate/2-iminopropanoate deaminase
MANQKIIVPGLARLPAFCHAVVAGDTIYVSGTLGTKPDSMELVEGGAGPQTTRTLHIIAEILAACGATLGDVVKMNVYLADMSAFGEMNAAYLAIMGGDPPARITVGRVELALGAAVEIDAIACRPAAG